MAKSSPSTSADPNPAKPYTVLARRYRSREFDELIGQEPIARTLLNAIESNRTAHAYLFCGTRGVGKTSMARIFAKALNATSNLKEQKAIGEAILRGDDLDVIEIDGASYRGVNEARDLIAGAGLSPARSPYKIYIIDEVHQLTKDAFNALLKTMEEPPSHVKFILCTTEPHKVPATIQSRCQRFDFRAIPTAKIAAHIRAVLKTEGVKADDEVIAQVARLGNGSMRDALSILDRLLAGGMDTLTIEHLQDMLGLPDHDLIVNLVDAFIAADAAAALTAGDQLLQKASGIEQALDLLTEHLRNMMIVAACSGEADFLDLSEEHMKSARRQAQAYDAQALVHMIAICDAVSRNARGSATARALFDAAVVRMAMSQRFADIPALLTGNSPAAGRAATEIESKKKHPQVTHAHPRDDNTPQPPTQPPTKAPPQAPTKAPPQATTKAPPPAPVPAAAHAVPTRAPAVAEIKPASDAPDDLATLWQRVTTLAAGSMVDRQIIEHLRVEAFDGTTLRLGIEDHGADMTRFVVSRRERISELVRNAAPGSAIRIELDDPALQSRSNAAATDQPLPDLVRKAMDLLDATVVKVD